MLNKTIEENKHFFEALTQSEEVLSDLIERFEKISNLSHFKYAL